MDELITIGRVKTAHGVRGELKVQPLTDYPGRFKQLTHLFLTTNDVKQKYIIEHVRCHQNDILLKLSGLDNRTEAETCKGALCQIDKALRLPLPTDRFYIDDLLNCSVYEDNAYIGHLTEVLQPGANDVYRVVREGKTDLMVPALKSVIRKVDVKEKRIDIVLPKGLE